MRTYLKTLIAVLGLVAAVLALLTAWIQFTKETASTPLIFLVVTPTLSQPGNQITGAVEVEIDSTRGWQSTNIYMQQGITAVLEVIGGSWTNWKGQAPYNSGEGGGYICAKQISSSQCIEPLPNFPSDSLIGQIGDFMFSVGNGNTITAEQSGELYLRINDGDDGLYDNDGKLRIRISIQD